MIKAISFDFYNTLVKFWPDLDEIQQSACREYGINVSKEGLNHGYAVADVFFNRANEEEPLSLRSPERRLEFFGEYEQMILAIAGVPVSRDLATQIWSLAISVPKDFQPFDDTILVLAQLKEKGYRLGVISNLRRDMDQLCRQVGLGEYLDYCVSADQAGAEKPHSPIFLAALKQSKTSPTESLHVGDQYRSDVLGARAVGMSAVLLDRGGWQDGVTDCPKISSLSELASLLDRLT